MVQHHGHTDNLVRHTKALLSYFACCCFFFTFVFYLLLHLLLLRNIHSTVYKSKQKKTFYSITISKGDRMKNTHIQRAMYVLIVLYTDTRREP